MLNFFWGNIFTVCGLIDKSSVDSDSFERQHWTSRLLDLPLYIRQCTKCQINQNHSAQNW